MILGGLFLEKKKRSSSVVAAERKKGRENVCLMLLQPLVGVIGMC